MGLPVAMEIDTSVQSSFLIWAENISVLIQGVWLWAANCGWSSERLAYETSTKRTLTLLQQLLQIL